MAAKYAMKVTYSGGSDIYFNQSEIVSATLRETDFYQIHGQQENKPEVAYFDNPVEVLTVVFELTTPDTETDIQTLLDEDEELTVYYAWQWDTSLNVKCVPMKDGVETVEVFGYAQANERKTVKFLKSGT